VADVHGQEDTLARGRSDLLGYPAVLASAAIASSSRAASSSTLRPCSE
jgi:hypothetical protein